MRITSSDPFLSANGLCLLFDNGADLMASARDDMNESWQSPVPLPESVNSSDWIESSPWLSDDGRVLLFDRWPLDPQLSFDERVMKGQLWLTTRPNVDADWERPVQLGLTGAAGDFAPCYCPADRTLYFGSHRAGGVDLWMSRLVRKVLSEDPSLFEMLNSGEWEWSTPENLGPPINTPHYDSSPAITADGRLLFFSSFRPGTAGGADIWVSSRDSIAEGWSTPKRLDEPVNSEHNESRLSISPDGLRLAFTAERFRDNRFTANIFFTERSTQSSPWTSLRSFEHNSQFWQSDPFVSSDGRLLLYSSGVVLRQCTRTNPEDAWSAPTELPETVNVPGDRVGGSWISSDHRVLLFQRDVKRDGGFETTIFRSMRESASDEWKPAVAAGIGSPGTVDFGPCYCPANRTLYFSSDRTGGIGKMDLWSSTLVHRSGPEASN